jgi:hypothetical protein
VFSYTSSNNSRVDAAKEENKNQVKLKKTGTSDTSILE